MANKKNSLLRVRRRQPNWIKRIESHWWCDGWYLLINRTSRPDNYRWSYVWRWFAAGAYGFRLLFPAEVLLIFDFEFIIIYHSLWRTSKFSSPILFNICIYLMVTHFLLFLRWWHSSVLIKYLSTGHANYCWKCIWRFSYSASNAKSKETQINLRLYGVTRRRKQQCLPQTNLQLNPTNIEWSKSCKLTFGKLISSTLQKANLIVKNLYPFINRKSELSMITSY